ncbi:MAG: hypothetical protein QXF86_03250 [Candidatus Bilamarchaeaceae archaeon]
MIVYFYDLLDNTYSVLQQLPVKNFIVRQMLYNKGTYIPFSNQSFLVRTGYTYSISCDFDVYGIENLNNIVSSINQAKGISDTNYYTFEASLNSLEIAHIGLDIYTVSTTFNANGYKVSLQEKIVNLGDTTTLYNAGNKATYPRIVVEAPFSYFTISDGNNVLSFSQSITEGSLIIENWIAYGNTDLTIYLDGTYISLKPGFTTLSVNGVSNSQVTIYYRDTWA